MAVLAGTIETGQASSGITKCLADGVQCGSPESISGLSLLRSWYLSRGSAKMGRAPVGGIPLLQRALGIATILLPLSDSPTYDVLTDLVYRVIL